MQYVVLTLGLLPLAGLETAVRVDEEKVLRDGRKHRSNTVLNLLLAGDARRVNVVDTGADLVGVAEALEGVEQLQVALGRLDGDDIGIKVLDGAEDVVEVGVAEVGVGLQSIGDTGGGELEGRKSPREVSLPVNLAERELCRADD